MKKQLTFLFFMPLLVALLSAAGTAYAEDLKIGVVITQKLIAGTEIGKNAARTLREKKEAAQERLDRKADEIKDLQKDLEKRLMVLSDEEKEKAREEFERKQRDGLRLKEDLERELKKEEAKVLGEVNEFLSKVVIEYGEQHGYDVILDASAALYFSDRPDITEQVIAAADAAYRDKR